MENNPSLDVHVDADTLAAFAEHSLHAAEESTVFAHLANCVTCRKYLAAYAELQDFHWNAATPGHHRFVFRSVGAAAGIACVVAALWLLLVTQSSPTSKVSAPAFNSKASWNGLPLHKLATNELLAARNSHRFFKEVTLATVSFGGSAKEAAPAVNQIVVNTILGERWITVDYRAARKVARPPLLVPKAARPPLLVPVSKRSPPKH